MMQLTEYRRKILAVLSTDGGFTTGDVARRVSPRFGHSNRTHSGAVRSWLVELEGLGLVCRLDGEKPVCWIKTAAGAAVKRELHAEGIKSYPAVCDQCHGSGKCCGEPCDNCKGHGSYELAV